MMGEWKANKQKQKNHLTQALESNRVVDVRIPCLTVELQQPVAHIWVDHRWGRPKFYEKNNITFLH